MRLVHAFTDTQTPKMQHGDDEDPGTMGPSALLSNRVSRPPLPLLSQHDYPHVKYWEKKVWRTFAGARKDTSELQIKSSSRGGTRSSKGENVMMLYIEDANGVPVDGNIAGDIREFARSIWRSLYERGMAPTTWGNARMEVHEEYFREMETEYPVLRLCSHHWKANAIATAIYSQWYKIYKKPIPCSDNSNGNDGEGSSNNNNSNNSDDETGDVSDGPPRKKSKATTIVDDDIPLTLPESPRSDLDVQCVDNGSSSRPRTALKDPLYVAT